MPGEPAHLTRSDSKHAYYLSAKKIPGSAAHQRADSFPARLRTNGFPDPMRKNAEFALSAEPKLLV